MVCLHMPETKLVNEAAARTSGFVARHPRFVASLTVFVLLLALSGGVAADGGAEITPQEGSDVDTGP